jgi:lactate permease
VDLPVVIVISLIQGGGQLLLSQVNQTLAAFIPATLSLVAILLIGRTKMYGKAWRIEDSKVMNRKNNGAVQDYPKNMSMHQAFLPYYVLTFVTLFILLIQPIKQFLGQIKFGFAFPETMTGYGYINAASSSFSPFSPLTHAGMFLLLASYIGYVFYKKHGWIEKEGGKAVLRRSFQKTLPSAMAVLGFILMSRVMGGTGQTVILAQGIASTFGKSYAILSSCRGNVRFLYDQFEYGIQYLVW